jgi:hypothetical protein
MGVDERGPTGDEGDDMNGAHLHLVLNHIPVLGSVFAAGLLAYGIGRRCKEVTRVALFVLAIAAAGGVVVYFTGEGAEEIVEELAGVSHDEIEEHEESALRATVALAIAGLAALALLAARRRESIPRGAAIVVLILALGAVFAMIWTANLGGQIRHSEITAGGAAALEGEHD